MRKLLNTCVLVLAFCLCGCSDDDGLTPELKVLSTTAKFDASGGEGKIEVQSPIAITAVSEEDWCTVSVSGQTVNVTVPMNETITGRTAMVVITAGDEILKVPVYQAGNAFICDLSNHVFPIKGGSVTFPFKTSCDVSVTDAPKWLSWKIQDEGIVFTAEAADKDRSARVTVTSGGSSVTAMFGQIVNVEGNYSLSFVDNKGVMQSGTGDVKKNGSLYDMTTQGMVINGPIIKIVYSEETSRMIISAGQTLGQVRTTDGSRYIVKLCAYSDDKYLSWDTNIQYVADAEFDETTGKVRFVFKDNGTWPGKKVIGLMYGAFNPSDGSFAQTSFGVALNLVMTKQ